MDTTNFIEVIKQKNEILKSLGNIDARSFGAMSAGEMQSISNDRVNWMAALKAVNQILNLPDYNGYK